MAHNLAFHTDSQGVARRSFASLREPAWHGLGQILEAPVSDNEWLKLAGLDWTADKMPLYRQDMETVPSHCAIVHSKTQQTLGVVTKDYQPVQNVELMDWIRGLDGYCDVVVETAAALGNGETVFISARCNGLTFDIGGDLHQGYMVLSNGHIGNRRLMINPSMVRPLCENTLAMATGHLVKHEDDKGYALKGNLTSGFALRHTKNIRDMMSDIQQAYARTTETWKQTEEVMRALALKPLTDDMLTTMITKPFEKPKKVNKDADALAMLLGEEAKPDGTEDEGVRAKAIAAERENRIRTIHESETCQRYDSTKNTLFSAFASVTEFITHEMPVRTGEGDTKGIKARFASNLMARGDDLKRTAFNVAMELLTV